MPFAFWYF